jgi:hypothetical protein
MVNAFIVSIAIALIKHHIRKHPLRRESVQESRVGIEDDEESNESVWVRPPSTNLLEMKAIAMTGYITFLNFLTLFNLNCLNKIIIQSISNINFSHKTFCESTNYETTFRFETS